ncbi:hypothetical protein C1645_878709 [Glomus cerebriforme]|uniref:Uncharacterized protein n=1 Tax=Glomus cerebriforme TaxID=658196 RepID=A0A397SK17_9GLOM|nr:hypothetical protein C1645_878709 [Glomus cerebriforme]
MYIDTRTEHIWKMSDTQVYVNRFHQSPEPIKLVELTKKAPFPEQECNVQTTTFNDINFFFRNIMFEYFQDTDNLSVYFVDKNAGVEDYCVDVMVFNKNPPNPVYNEDSDILKVNLVYSILPTKFVKTEMEDIEVGTDDVGNIICLLFHNASNRIAEELSPE